MNQSIKILNCSHLFAIAFIAAPSHQGACLSRQACDLPAKPPPPFAIELLPDDIQYAIIDSVQDPRDRRAMALALSKAVVSAKVTNEILIELLRFSQSKNEPGFDREEDKSMFRHLIDRGIVPTRNSGNFSSYKALEEELNARTNKPFKFFDTILLTANWQDDPFWQAWNWTTVSAIEVELKAVIKINHDELPMSRLNNLKDIRFMGPQNYEAIGPLLKLNPSLETLALFMDRNDNVKEIALATCALEHLKILGVGLYKAAKFDFLEEFAAEYMKCLPAKNKLEVLGIRGDGYYDFNAIRPFAITSNLIEKLIKLKIFLCTHCQPEWAEQPNLEQLIWVQGLDPAQNVKALKNILKMTSLVHLRLNLRLRLSPEEADLVRRISLQVKEVKLIYEFASVTSQ